MRGLFSKTANVTKNFVASLKKHEWNTYLYLVLAAAFLVRILNINYNTAFNDEAIYIVVGRMGLFASDWWTYGARSWMAGLPYIYPTLTALAYQSAGLIGSRLLNVVFGTLIVEEVFRFTKLLNLFSEKINNVAALIAAVVICFSGIGIYTSKLATYDMPSFLLMLLAINSFLKAKDFTNGKYYFLAYVFLLTAFLTKIVAGIFFPLLLVLSFFVVKERDKKHRNLARNYFYIPLFISIGLYTIFNYQSILVYTQTQRHLGLAADYMRLLEQIIRIVGIVIAFSIPGFAALIYKRKTYEAAALLSLASVIPAFHLVTHRLATFDKHLFLTSIFLSVVIGYGFSLLLNTKKVASKKVTLFCLIALFCVQTLYSFFLLNNLQSQWENTTNLENYLVEKVKPGEKILTEEGAVVALVLYDNVFPPKDVVTFDWIDYSGYTGERGYEQALTDKYFDYVELSRERNEDKSFEEFIRNKLGKNYRLIKIVDNFEIYARVTPNKTF